MSQIIAYVDESGDLGWKLDQPYRNGGSSRFMTIAAVLTTSKPHAIERSMRRLYKKHKWDPSKEKKWANMNLEERLSFAREATNLADRNKSIHYRSITVMKENAQNKFKQDPEKLYNYMLRISLLPTLSRFATARLIPDHRNFKVQTGNQLHPYLVSQLRAESCQTSLTTTPAKSKESLSVQFADMLAGAIQGHHEDGNSRPYNLLQEALRGRESNLFYPEGQRLNATF